MQYLAVFVDSDTFIRRRLPQHEPVVPRVSEHRGQGFPHVLRHRAPVSDPGVSESHRRPVLRQTQRASDCKRRRTVQNRVTIGRVTDRGEGANHPPGKLNLKTGPHSAFSLYFGFSILLVFSRLLFFCVFPVVSGDFGF